MILDFQPYILYQDFHTDWVPSNYFWHLWFSTLFFVLADTLWVMRVPHCVRTPRTIIEVRVLLIMARKRTLKF